MVDDVQLQKDCMQTLAVAHLSVVAPRDCDVDVVVYPSSRVGMVSAS